MAQDTTHDGYKRVMLTIDGIRYRRGVHRLMCIAFYGDQPGMQAAHDNDIHDDNRIENLSWKTPKENCADRDRRVGSPIGVRKIYG